MNLEAVKMTLKDIFYPILVFGLFCYLVFVLAEIVSVVFTISLVNAFIPVLIAILMFSLFYYFYIDNVAELEFKQLEKERMLKREQELAKAKELQRQYEESKRKLEELQQRKLEEQRYGDIIEAEYMEIENYEEGRNS